MKLKMRLQSVAWMAGGMAVGLTAWALTIGVPSSSSSPAMPTVTLEQAAASVSPSPSLPASATAVNGVSPTLRPQTRLHKVIMPRDVTPSEAPTTTTSVPTEIPSDVPSGDGVQGPGAPIQMPAPNRDQPTSTPSRVGTN